jgi:hypothetical protein
MQLLGNQRVVRIWTAVEGKVIWIPSVLYGIISYAYLTSKNPLKCKHLPRSLSCDLHSRFKRKELIFLAGR